MISLPNYSLRIFIIISTLCIFGLPLPIFAEIINDVSRDFGIVSGYVVKNDGKEVIIDLNSQQHISLGDLFGVIKPGSELVHPFTKQVLGRLEDTKGQLQVTQIQEGYSYTRIISGEGDIRPGDVIRRFKGTDAVFWDYRGHSEPFYNKLRLALPHLNWHDYVSSQLDKPVEKDLAPRKWPSLYFIMRRDFLEVRDPGFVVLHSYRLDEADSVTSEHTMAPATSPDKEIIGYLPDVDKGTAIIRRDISGNENPWNSPTMNGTPVGMEVGDFDGDGKQEIAVAFPDRVEIGRNLKGDYRLIETLSVGRICEGVALDGADLEGKGRMELFVSAVGRDGTPASVMIGNVNGHYKIIQKGIPWLMRRVTLPGEGPVLLGQSGEFSDKRLQGPVFRITSSGGHLIKGSKLDIPSGLGLYGFALLGDASYSLFAYLAYNDHLRVAKINGEVLWEGGEQVGGSESSLEIPPAVMGMDDPEVMYLNARLEMSEAGELLVPVNRGYTMISRMRSYTESELKAMVWNGSTLKETWCTAAQKGYLADFRIADGDNDGQKDLVTAFAFTRSNPLRPRESVIHIYQLR